MTEKSVGAENLKILQEQLCKMLKEFKEKCDEHGIEYCLAFGTLLGAIRHGGFVPWDDDIDLFMKREDADRFVELFKDYYSEDCYIDGYNCKEYNSFAPNIRINSKHFLLRQDKNGKEAYLPAFLSIFIIDGLPNNKFLRKIQIRRMDFYYNILRVSRSCIQGVPNIKNRSIKDKIFIALNKTFRFGAIVPPRKAAEWFNNAQRKYVLKENNNFVHIDFPGQVNRVVEKSIFDNFIYHDFDGVQHKIPKNYDKLLTIFYGDYMQLPPEEARVPQHGTEFKIV